MTRKNQPRAFWCPVELLLLKRLYPSCPLRELPSHFLGKNREQIRNKIKRFALTSRKSLKSSAIVHDYFSVVSPQNAYWAGFIAADGCIQNDWLFTIGIALPDRDHLMQLASALGIPDGVRDVAEPGARVIKGKLCKTKGISRLSVSSPAMILDLKGHYSITRRKSLTLRPPQIKDRKCRLAYLAGYIDGDGTIAIDERGHIRVYLVGTKPLLEWVRRLVDGYLAQYHLPMSFPPHPYRSSALTYSYGVTGHKAECILNQILRLELPLLKRKWSKLKVHQAICNPFPVMRKNRSK